MRHHRHGSPRDVLGAAVRELQREGLEILRLSPVIMTSPIGPSRRRYANCAALVQTGRLPEALLALLKRVEARFGARRGQRWSSRVLDCDIILWEGGCWGSKRLTVPHPAYRSRSFVLRPARAIAPRWRDPISGKTIGQIHACLTRPRPAPTGTSTSLPPR